jgi:hypothetical protein
MNESPAAVLDLPVVRLADHLTKVVKVAESLQQAIRVIAPAFQAADRAFRTDIGGAIAPLSPAEADQVVQKHFARVGDQYERTVVAIQLELARLLTESDALIDSAADFFGSPKVPSAVTWHVQLRGILAALNDAMLTEPPSMGLGGGAQTGLPGNLSVRHTSLRGECLRLIPYRDQVHAAALEQCRQLQSSDACPRLSDRGMAVLRLLDRLKPEEGLQAKELVLRLQEISPPIEVPESSIHRTIREIRCFGVVNLPNVGYHLDRTHPWATASMWNLK